MYFFLSVMRIRISDKTKIHRGYGKGEGKDYKPWITVSEFNSIGTTSVIRDWKTGRQVHCLSQGEALWYCILRWDDNNIDIREQFPLNAEETVRIARENGFKHPVNDSHVMTTDFLVTERDGSLHAYSVKPSRKLSRRNLEILCIEKIYWQVRNVPFTMLFKTDANRILAANIRLVTNFYDASVVFDKYSALKHKIATKECSIDMEHDYITTELLDKLLEVRHG